jgi:antitoxin component YwqK of YwqJK toxin-antitoxin module
MNAKRMKVIAELTQAAALVGCAHGQKEANVELLKIERQDARTRTTESYTGYLNAKGRLVRHGLYVDHYPSGAKYVEAHYKHGKLDGEFRVFTEEGQTALVGSYKQGKPWDGLLQSGDHVKRYADGKFCGYVNLADPQGTNTASRR